MSTTLEEGEEREEMLLKLSRSITTARSLNWMEHKSLGVREEEERLFSVLGSQDARIRMGTRERKGGEHYYLIPLVSQTQHTGQAPLWVEPMPHTQRATPQQRHRQRATTAWVGSLCSCAPQAPVPYWRLLTPILTINILPKSMVKWRKSSSLV